MNIEAFSPKQVFRNFLYGEPSRRTAAASLPSQTVLDAITYRPNAELTLREVGYLMDSGFPDVASMYALKALQHDLPAQKELLKQYVKTITEDPTDSHSLRGAISQLDPTLRVEAGELKWISFHGAELWNDLSRGTLEKIRKQGKPPVLIANGALIGLRNTVSTLRESSLPFYILTPKWAADDSNPVCGYTIDLHSDQQVSFLPKSSDRPSDVVLVDDTLDTGKSIQEASAFWYQNTNGTNNQEVAIFQDGLK